MAPDAHVSCIAVPIAVAPASDLVLDEPEAGWETNRAHVAHCLQGRLPVPLPEARLLAGICCPVGHESLSW